MKVKRLQIILSMCLFSGLLTGCSSGDSPKPTSSPATFTSEKENRKMLELRINGQVFALELMNNSTVNELLSVLPDTFTMQDLNQNEKYFELPQNLPMQQQRVEEIQKGDVMLYGKNTLVIFYRSFTTNYSYTRIGRIGNSDKLADRLGADAVLVERIN